MSDVLPSSRRDGAESMPPSRYPLSKDCWCCGRITYADEPHAEWCWASGDGRYYTDNENRWPKGR